MHTMTVDVVPARLRCGSGIAGRGGTWMIVERASGKPLSARLETKAGLSRAVLEYLAGPKPQLPENLAKTHVVYARRNCNRFGESYIWVQRRRDTRSHTFRKKHEEMSLFTPDPTGLIVCETTAAIITHLRRIADFARPPAFSGHRSPQPRTLCDKPAAWDMTSPIATARCVTCREVAIVKGSIPHDPRMRRATVDVDATIASSTRGRSTRR